MTQALPHQHGAETRGDEARPQEDDAGNGAAVLAIAHGRTAICGQQLGRLGGVDAGDVCELGGGDDGQGESGGEGEHAGKHAANAPGDLDGGRLVALGPEEVEEEGSAENGGDVDADEDVVRGGADVVVVVYMGAGVQFGNKLLLVDVVCRYQVSGGTCQAECETWYLIVRRCRGILIQRRRSWRIGRQ